MSADVTGDETWGYGQPEMYLDRWRLIQPCLVKKDFTLVDWGSDAGWFSVQVAHEFPGARVLSIDSGIMSRGAGIREHKKRLHSFGLNNNQIVESHFGPPTFVDLKSTPSDYQLVLSVFHHMGDGFGPRLRHRHEWETAFCNLIASSASTFFEVPESGDRETPHRIERWLSGRTLSQAMRESLAHGDVEATVTLLGTTLHPHKGERSLFRIDLDAPQPTATAAAIREHILERSRAARPRGVKRAKQMAANVQHALSRAR